MARLVVEKASPLFKQIEQCQYIIKSLPDKGADVNAKSYNGETPTRGASEKGHDEPSSCSRTTGLISRPRVVRGNRSLDLARSEGNDEVVRVLGTQAMRKTFFAVVL